MAGVNSLGIGSGVLTADVLDQLREADNSVILKPIETKLELANQKEEASKLLSNFMTTFKASTSSLGSDNLYLGRTAEGSNDNITVTAQDGADLSSFNITNINKAEQDVWKSTLAFTDKTTALSNLDTGTLSISLNGTAYEVDYDASDSLDDIRQEINDQTAGVMTASILQIGTDNYEIVITAKDTNQAITFSDSNTPVQQTDKFNVGDVSGNLTGDVFSLTYDGVDYTYTTLTDGESAATIADALALELAADANTTIASNNDGTFTITSDTAGTALAGDIALSNNLAGGGTFTDSSANTTTTENVVGNTAGSLATALNLDNIQVAKEATFDYNGITISRDTNNISDLVNGVTITLNQNQEATDSASISIGQNTTGIKTEMDLLVTNFNLLASNLNDMTIYDQTTGVAGIFNSESSVKSIIRDLTRVLSQTDGTGNSLFDYGLEIDKKGVMSLDSSKFSAKLKEDPVALELLFRGASEIDTARQLDTITLVGNVTDGDTFSWSDGNGYSINLSQANGDFTTGDTPAQTAEKIATLMNDDPTFSTSYTATIIDDVFTIEAKKPGVPFNGTTTSTGGQTSIQSNTTRASASTSPTPAVIGIFQQLDDTMYSYTGSSQILASFDTNLENLKSNLIKEYDKQKEALDVRYETMTKKFAAYDSMINKLNNQFSSLKLLIDSEGE